MTRRFFSKRCTSRIRGLEGGGGFTLPELLMVVGLSALLAVPMAHLVRGSLLAGDSGAEGARTATLYASVLSDISDEIRTARSAKVWMSAGIELELPDRNVRYGATKTGVYRTMKLAGGMWIPDPSDPLIDWAEPGTLEFDFEADGLVVVILSGDDVSFRTAVVPRGGNGLMGGGS